MVKTSFLDIFLFFQIMQRKLKDLKKWKTNELSKYKTTLDKPEKETFKNQLKEYLEELEKDKENIKTEIKETEFYKNILIDKLKFVYDEDVTSIFNPHDQNKK